MKFAVLVCSMAIGAMADEMGPCSLCPPGVPVINVDVVFPGTDPGGPQFTCGDLETLAPLIGGQAGSEECDALAAVGGLCCEGLAECTLCEGGAPPGTPDLVLPGTDQTCGDFEFLILAIPEDQCDSTLTGSGVNFPDICNCPVAETPSPTPAPTVPPTPAPTVPPTPAPTVPPTPAPTVPPTPAPVVPPTPAPVVPPTPAPVVPPTPAPVVPPTPAPVVPPTPAPVEPPTATPAPVEPPTTTPAPVEPPTTTPAPVEPPTTTPAPVEPPTTTPAPVEPPTTTPAPVEPPTTTPAPVEPPTTTPAPVEPLPPETSPPGLPEVSTDLIVTLIGTVAAQFPIPAYETACTSFMVANYPNITNILCTVTATSSLRARRLRELQSESLDVFTTVSGESMDPDALSMVDTTISENSDEFVSLLQAENSLAFANVTGVEAAGVDPPALGSDAPSDVPSDMPSGMPSDAPSDAPSDTPSDVPSSTPTPEPDTDLCSSSKSKTKGKGMQSSKSSKSGKGKGGKGCKKSKKKKKTMSSSSSMDSKIRRRHI